MRVILAVMLAIIAIVPISGSANAAHKGKMQLWKGTSLTGAKVSFKCKATEKCCFNAVEGKGNCVASSATCL